MAELKDGAQMDPNKKSWFKPWMLVPVVVGLALFIWLAERV